MRQIFNYRKFNDGMSDGIVETFQSLLAKSMDKKNDTPEYKEANSALNETFMKFCVEAIPGRQFESMEDIKNPMIHNDPFFIQRFNTILAQVITPVIPTVIANKYDTLYDTVQVGFGDNAKFHVASNELFIVNDIAEGIARGGVQTSVDTEYTVQARPQQIALYVDWYLVASNRLDWGYMVQKVGDSYAAWVQSKVVSAMASCITNAAQWGISGYIANGFTDANFVTTVRNVELANRGAQVYGLGTKLALMEILPAESATSGFRYGENSDIVKRGFLPSYKGTPLVELGNALIPNTQNSTPQVVVPDDIIYLIPMGMHKPVKSVVEGNSISIAQDPLRSADHCYGFTLTTHIGVDTIVGTKFGAINLV